MQSLRMSYYLQQVMNHPCLLMELDKNLSMTVWIRYRSCLFVHKTHIIRSHVCACLLKCQTSKLSLPAFKVFVQRFSCLLIEARQVRASLYVVHRKEVVVLGPALWLGHWGEKKNPLCQLPQFKRPNWTCIISKGHR